MKMFAITILTVLCTLAHAQYTHNLDDQQHLSMITQSGIKLSQNIPTTYLTISSNGGSTGYSWILDRQSCYNVVQIDAEYVYSPPSDDVVGSSGQEVYTLTAEKYGKCTFRIAFARSWEFLDFNDHKSKNGYMIEIPLHVVGSDASYDPSQGGRAAPADRCNDAIENCDLKDQLGIDEKTRRAFSMLGISTWVRAILGLNPVGNLPTAITFLMASNGK